MTITQLFSKSYGGHVQLCKSNTCWPLEICVIQLSQTQWEGQTWWGRRVIGRFGGWAWCQGGVSSIVQKKKHEVIHTRSQMCRRAAWPGRSWEKGGNLGNGENNNNVLVTFGRENGTYTFMFMISDTFIQSSSMIEHRGAETVCPAHSCIVYICY